MKRRPSYAPILVEDRPALVQQVNHLFNQGKRAEAIFHTIRLGISDGHQHTPESACPFPQPDLQDVWKANRKIGLKNNSNHRQSDLFHAPLGIERPDNEPSLKP